MLLLFILRFADGASQAGRDLFTIFAAFASMFERFTKTDCPKGLDPGWKSTPAVKVQADNSRIPRSNSPILVTSVTDKQNKEEGGKNQNASLFSCLEIEGRYSSTADDINKTVVLLTATILVFGKHGAPSKLRLSHCAAAKI